VCSTKALTAQLTVLLAWISELSQKPEIAKTLSLLPALVQQCLAVEPYMQQWAVQLAHKAHALFLGRGIFFPVALEGALKLKEISYIHAEAYPAGELKHGPLALVDQDMPVIVLAPYTAVLEKLKSSIQEVRARGGELFVCAPRSANIHAEPHVHVLEMPEMPEYLAPIAYIIPLQLLSYYVAVSKGTDVDQPRNLAKSVTVE
jgi:glucosamine--fructose-6-phosphate aminotransferase (isomerizing)